MFELISAVIALVGTAIVSYADYKTGYMPDRYTHAMIIIGALLLPFHAGLEKAVPHYLAALVTFVVLFLFYIFGQLGGGDVKLFTALTLLIPVYPVSLVQFGFSPTIAPYPFIVSVFFAAVVMAMLFVSSGYLLRLYRDRKKIAGVHAKVVKGLLFALLTLPLIGLWVWMNSRMAVMGLPLVLGAFAMAFKEDILRLYVVKRKAVKDLNDDDVLALEFISASVKNKLGLGSRRTFLEMELKELKNRARKAGVKQLVVQEYLPKFGPFIMASLALNLVVGDVLLWLLLA